MRYHILLQLFKSFGDEKSSFEFLFFISLTFPQLFSPWFVSGGGKELELEGKLS